MHIYSVFWTLNHLLLVVGPHFGIEHEGVDCDVSSTGIGLHSSGHETLREEESGSPVCIHSSVLNPLSEEHHSLDEVINPAGKRFERGVCNVLPHLRHFFIEERQEHVLQLDTHHNRTFNGFLKIA